MEKEESNLNDIKQDNSEKNEVSDIQDLQKIILMRTTKKKSFRQKKKF